MLNFRCEGEGPAILFLHGFLESISMWDFLPLDQIKGTKIFIDLPGHGNSELCTNTEVPSLQLYADEVFRVLKHLKINRFSVVGHSMGGYVALLLKQQSQGCEKVILLNSNFWSDNEQKKKDRIRIADIAFKAKRILIQESIPNLFGNPEKFLVEIEKLKSEAMHITSESIAFASLAMRERSDFSIDFNANSKEYFLIHGANDRLIETSQVTSKIKNNSQFFLIPNTGHMAHIESTQQVSTILKLILN